MHLCVYLYIIFWLHKNINRTIGNCDIVKNTLHYVPPVFHLNMFVCIIWYVHLHSGIPFIIGLSKVDVIDPENFGKDQSGSSLPNVFLSEPVRQMVHQLARDTEVNANSIHCMCSVNQGVYLICTISDATYNIGVYSNTHHQHAALTHAYHVDRKNKTTTL